jgi:hypothetical protein
MFEVDHATKCIDKGNGGRIGNVIEREREINPNGSYSIECNSPSLIQYNSYANDHHNGNFIGNSIDSIGKDYGAIKVHGRDESARNKD